MELFAILLSLPVALLLSSVYCLTLAKVIARSQSASHWLRVSSWVIWGILVTELLLLSTLGAVKSRELIGSAFYFTHVSVFILSLPALANLLVLRGGVFVRRWFLAAAICSVVAVPLVFLQYGVSEALYGVEDALQP
jgi:hypothetical protein